MNEKEMARIKDLQFRYDIKRVELCMWFILKLGYKVGDIFEDHKGKILIEKITRDFDEESMYPMPVYYGKIITRKGVSEKRRTAYYNDRKETK